MIYPRMEHIFMILYENSVVKFWPGLDSGELKGGSEGWGRGVIFCIWVGL